jgi:hypothetical protein
MTVDATGVVVLNSGMPGYCTTDIARDLDGLFDRYVKEVQMIEASASTGLILKDKHTVRSAWPSLMN